MSWGWFVVIVFISMIVIGECGECFQNGVEVGYIVLGHCMFVQP